MSAGAATLATGSTVGNLTLANGSITDSGGSISFGDESLSTSGTLASGAQTVTGNVTSSATISAEQLTTTDDLTVTDEASIDGTMAISTGSITDSGGTISFGDENLSTTGTLSTGVATLANGSTVGNLTLANGSITDSNGSIDFGNENLSTSGNLTVTTSVQTTTIDYTDGTLALTVAADGTVTSSGNIVTSGDLTVSGNDIKDNGGSAAITFDGSSNMTTGGTVTTGGSISAGGAVIPSSANGAALGSASKEWSDIYIADGAVINLGDDEEVTLTHVHNDGLILNSDNQFQFRDSDLKIYSSTDGQLDIDANTEVEITTTTLDINGAVDASGDVTVGTSLRTGTIDYTDGTLALTVAANGALTTSGNLAVGGTLSGDGSGLTGVPAGSLASDNLTQGDAAVTLSTSSGAVNITPASGSAIVLDGTINVDAGVVTGATSLTVDEITSNTGIVPDDADGAYLGTSSAEFSDLFLADGAVVNLGNDQDVTLTHIADTGLLLNVASQLQFRDSDLKVHSSADGQLDIDANTEVEITTTTLDINAATLDVNGDVDLVTQATDIDLIDNNSSAISFDANGKAGILEIITTNSSESVNMSGNIDVNGTANLDVVDIDGAMQLDATLTVGTDGSGQDVVLYSGTAGDNLTWDASEEVLIVTGTNGQTAVNVADGNLVVADAVDIEGNIDVNGTANLDVVDIDGAMQLDATLTVGADGSGQDVVLYSGTAGDNLTWDASEEVLIVTGTNGQTAVNVADGNLVVADVLDANGSSNFNGTVSLDGSSNELRFYEGSNYVGFEAPSLSGDQIWVLPTADGSSDQVLSTNGSGTLSWSDVSATTVGTLTGASPLVLEGSTSDDFETTLSVTDPTADRTLTFPNVNGTFLTTGNMSSITTTGTVTSGEWTGTAIADAYVANDLTISGGSIDNTVIGASSKAAASVTSLNANGTVSLDGSSNELRFYEGANYVGFEAPSLGGDQIWVLPASDGTSNQVLSTNGSGTLSWATTSSSTVTITDNENTSENNALVFTSGGNQAGGTFGP